MLPRYISTCFNQFPFSFLCMLFCLLNRSTTRLPLWRMMTSYFTRRECESQCNATVTLTLRQQEQLAKYCLCLHVADIPDCISPQLFHGVQGQLPVHAGCHSIATPEAGRGSDDVPQQGPVLRRDTQRAQCEQTPPSPHQQSPSERLVIFPSSSGHIAPVLSS